MATYIFIIAATLAQSPPPIVQTRRGEDAFACGRLQQVVELSMGDLPNQVDAITRTDGVSVLCGLRTYAVNQSVSVTTSQFRPGWRERERYKWEQVVCRNEALGPLVRRGWRFTKRMTFTDGEIFSTDAVCAK